VVVGVGGWIGDEVQRRVGVNRSRTQSQKQEHHETLLRSKCRVTSPNGRNNDRLREAPVTSDRLTNWRDS
jgi:hypothetical protein